MKVFIGAIIDLVMFLPLIFWAFLFRKTRKNNMKYKKLKNIIQSITGEDLANNRQKFNLKIGSAKARKEFAFPRWFKFILYSISFLFMISSIFFTILKGFKN
jgi:hypothetical protein